MSGSIEAGDAIVIEKSDTYKVGDIITYFPAADNVSVTHRIVRIEGEKYYAKGDSNESEDPDPIFITQIAGKMTGHIPKIGIIIEWLRTWQGIAFMLAVGAVVIALIMVAEQDDDDQPETITPDSAFAGRKTRKRHDHRHERRRLQSGHFVARSEMLLRPCHGKG